MISTSTSPTRILLADDDKDDRFFFAKALKEIDFPTELQTAYDGQRLMDILLQTDILLPNVLFIDLNMPRKNGAECVTEIKNDKRLNHIPLVVYSTSIREEVADLLYEKGVHYCVYKCGYNDLARAIVNVLILLSQNPDRPERAKFFINEINY